MMGLLQLLQTILSVSIKNSPLGKAGYIQGIKANGDSASQVV